MSGPSGSPSAAVAELARRHGVALSYIDAQGLERVPSSAAVVAVLAALGLPIESAADAELLLRSPEGQRGTSAVAIVRDGRARFELGAAGTSTPTGVRAALVGGSDAGAEVEIAVAFDDGRFVVDMSELGGSLSAGVHEMSVEDATGERHVRYLVVGGDQCAHGPHPPRSWGLFAPTAALRRADRPDQGAGDLSVLADFAATSIAMGGRVVGTLPLTATAPDEASPYSPLSRRFWDERWVDPNWVAAQLGLAGWVDTRPTTSAPLIDPARVAAGTRRALVEILAQSCPTGGLPPAAETWRAANPQVERWARWKAVAHLGGWKPEVRTAGGASMTVDTIDPRLVDIEVFAQWAVSAQLASLGSRLAQSDASLYLDLAVGVSNESFDVWDRPERFAQGVSIGAPPDRFFPGGQSWGLAPLLPQVGSAEGHAYFRECLAHHMAVCGLLRIDHVMGMHRLFWVPDGMDATEGTYVTYPAEELWAITAAMSASTGCGVVGEDLGTVPEEVRESMQRVGVSGMFIGQDEVRAPLRLGRPVPSAVVASLNTHDLDPFAVWHDHAEVVLGSGPSEARDHVLAELALSAADVVLVSEQDLSLDSRRINVPGTVGGSVWRERCRLSVDELANGDGLGADARRVGALVDAWRHTARGSFPRGATTWLDDSDIESFHDGLHARLADRFGVHPWTASGMVGAAAAVWAPRAWEVNVAGDFDGWVGTPLTRRLGGDVWEGFLPSAVLGDRYKIRVRAADGSWVEKSDPFARVGELPPQNASIVTADDPCEAGWTDADWMEQRPARHRAGHPMSIYELHLGSWKRRSDGAIAGYVDLAPMLIEHIVDLGYTHVEIMPIMEHPFGGSWGYHVTGYFAPTSRYGTPAEFGSFVDQLHAAGIGVILDWVPAHFPDDIFGLADFDGQPLFEYGDPKMGRHPEWGSRVFDWGRPEVRAFLVSSALWWIDRYHVDGLRVDAVASMLYRSYGRSEGEWIPNELGGTENLEAVEFVRQLTRQVHAVHPDALVIAEESTSWPGVTRALSEGGLGFDLKWDLGWMHDMLEYLAREPVYRAWHQDDLTFRSMYSASERFVQPLSHDEVVHGKASLVSKMAGDDWQRRANLRMLYGHQYTTPGVPLLFMGGELAMNEEWNHEAELPWYLLEYAPHRGIADWIRELNRLLHHHPALADAVDVGANFEWIDCADSANSVLAWVRRTSNPDDDVVVTANFTPRPHDGYRIGLPGPGRWHLLANSDSNRWGGSGYPLSPVIEALEEPHGHWQHSGIVTLAPLGLMMLGRDRR